MNYWEVHYTYQTRDSQLLATKSLGFTSFGEVGAFVSIKYQEVMIYT